LETCKARERAFAVFSLNGLFFSSDVRIEVRRILKLLKKFQEKIKEHSVHQAQFWNLLVFFFIQIEM
jgi:hypothetical protein